MLELHVLFSGRVQGVGFRYTAQKHAEKLGLTGTVQNLSNGKVKLIAQGEKESLERLLILLNEIFPGSIVENREIGSIKQPYSSFLIKT